MVFQTPHIIQPREIELDCITNFLTDNSRKSSFFSNGISSWSIHFFNLTLSGRRPLSYRIQSNDLQSKSMDWILYDNGLRHERDNGSSIGVLQHHFITERVRELLNGNLKKLNSSKQYKLSINEYL